MVREDAFKHGKPPARAKQDGGLLTSKQKARMRKSMEATDSIMAASPTKSCPAVLSLARRVTSRSRSGRFKSDTSKTKTEEKTKKKTNNNNKQKVKLKVL